MTRPLPLARFLFANHLPLLVLTWLGLLVLALGVTFAIALFSNVSSSIWDFAPQLLRWLAIFYGVHFTRELLPLYVTYGQTRRDFMVQISLFFLGGMTVLAGLMTFGYVLEGLLYQFMGWSQVIMGDKLYAQPNDYLLIALSYWVHLVGYTVIGAFVGAGYYRSDAWGMVTLPFAMLFVVLVTFSIGGNDFPIIGNRIPVLEGTPVVSGLLGLFTVLTGLGVTWWMVRDIPIRTQSV